MVTFSERHGYVSLTSVLIRERLTEEIINAICTSYDLLYSRCHADYYLGMEKYLWCNFLNKRLNDFFVDRDGSFYAVATEYVKSDDLWFRKMDIIEMTISYLADNHPPYFGDQFLRLFVESLNSAFKRLYFAYRIVDNKIIEITSQKEVDTIETALQNSSKGAKEHLHTALELLSKRPDGDYRNSMKESISAVEATVREITGANTLNFKSLESAGIVLPSVLKRAFESLYGYTNDKTTGIRHALMDDTNAPDADEAIFMLVSCSAFINYLNKKKK